MDYLKYGRSRYWAHLISMPFIWLPLPFLLVCDAVCFICQFVCFNLYGIKWVKRSEYILVFDRSKLAYLNGWQKIGCMYCGYANGVLRYMKEVAGRLEKYWCGIMHENIPGFKIQEDQQRQNFARFGDQQDFEGKYGKN